MKIEINCSSCQSILRVDATHRGKQLRCPVCQVLNPIPLEDAQCDPSAREDATTDFGSWENGESEFAHPPKDGGSIPDEDFQSYQPQRHPTPMPSYQASGTQQIADSSQSTSMILGILGIVLNMGCGGCFFPLLFMMNCYGLFLAINSTGSTRQASIILNSIALAMSGFWVLLMLFS